MNNQLLQMECLDTKDVLHHVATKRWLGEYFLTWKLHMHNPCASLSADKIFPIAWNCITQLEAYEELVKKNSQDSELDNED